MKRLLLAFMLILPLIGSAKIPDEEDIRRKIFDPTSKFYYINLMMRYNNLERLNDDEYHYLYYGFAFQENYKPTASNPSADELYASLAGLNTENPDQRQLEEIVIFCNRALEQDPFSPTILNLLVYAYGTMGDKEKEKAYFYHLNGVMETIKTSGDGRSEKYPMHILMFSHAIDVVNSMGLQSRRPQIISRSVEMVPLVTPHEVPDGKKIRGYYFDYSRIYRNKPEGATFKRERTWQFNNLGVKEYK